MIQDYWFDSLTTIGLRDHHSWLANLPSRIERIANFGCWSGSEPFALIWTLDAKEVTVVEIERKFIEEFREQIDTVSHRYPESVEGRTINYVCGDMTKHLPELPDQYYDLAYCEDVLYTLQGNPRVLERGISQMVRVIKPNGFVVAVEPKFGAQFETRESDILGISISLPVPVSEPKDMSGFFPSKELRKLEGIGCPPFTYCYQKNQD